MSDSNDDKDVPAWFAALRGRWRLRRCVLAGPLPRVEARLSGEVRLLPTPSGQALHYEESGVLRLRHGAVLQSTRRYLYRVARDGADTQLAIDFADGPSSGLPFVCLPWPALQTRDATEGADVHLCGADRYWVRYRFEAGEGEGDVARPDWQRVVQRTRVRGPQKDYAIVSILDRIIETGSVSLSDRGNTED